MKKIGGVIVSQLNHTNYGSFLQAFATLKVIENAGWDITFIKYKKRRNLLDWIKIAPGLMLSGGLELIFNKIKFKINSCRYPEYEKNQKIRQIATNELKNRYFVPHFKEYIGYKKLCEGSKEYDVCFVGSDQVWRPFGFYSNYWNLNFVDDSIPKFSYASSYGVSKIPSVQKNGTRRYLERLDLISVREQKAKEIVETYSSKKAEVVADPTMLLTPNDWLEFANQSKKELPKDPYIFCYFLGNRADIRSEARKLADSTGLKIVIMRHMDEYVPSDELVGDYAPYDINAYDFVKLLSNAKYVCTDSFHGTVFSILTHRKFITFYRVKPTNGNSTHSRIDSLLYMFNLEERKFSGDIRDIEKEIDYNSVDITRNTFRRDSLDFLDRALKLGEK